MSADLFIGPLPPEDGREWDAQCARCGSSVTFVDCESCDEYGFDSHDCGEDSCCCLDDSPNVPCRSCDGLGGWHACLSSGDWCEANPLEGCEPVPSGAIEWFVLPVREPSP